MRGLLPQDRFLGMRACSLPLGLPAQAWHGDGSQPHLMHPHPTLPTTTTSTKPTGVEERVWGCDAAQLLKCYGSPEHALGHATLHLQQVQLHGGVWEKGGRGAETFGPGGLPGSGHRLLACVQVWPRRTATSSSSTVQDSGGTAQHSNSNAAQHSTHSTAQHAPPAPVLPPAAPLRLAVAHRHRRCLPHARCRRVPWRCGRRGLRAWVALAAARQLRGSCPGAAGSPSGSHSTSRAAGRVGVEGGALG